MVTWLTRILVLGSLVAAGCGGGSSTPTTTSADDAAAADDAEGADTLVADAAPETAGEACGYKLGNTLCDGELQGYLRNEVTGLATSAEYTTFKLSDVLASGTQQYAFVTSSAFW